MEIMIDIETMSLSTNNAIVLSIGAVKFDLLPEIPERPVFLSAGRGEFCVCSPRSAISLRSGARRASTH